MPPNITQNVTDTRTVARLGRVVTGTDLLIAEYRPGTVSGRYPPLQLIHGGAADSTPPVLRPLTDPEDSPKGGES